MAKTAFSETSFCCGSCHRPLLFMRKRGLIPGAWYVHADTRRFECGKGKSPNTNTADLELRIKKETSDGRGLSND